MDGRTSDNMTFDVQQLNKISFIKPTAPLAGSVADPPQAEPVGGKEPNSDKPS
jgi:hypothetical protein